MRFQGDECVSITAHPLASIDRHVNKLWLSSAFLDCVNYQEQFRFKLVVMNILNIYFYIINPRALIYQNQVWNNCNYDTCLFVIIARLVLLETYAVSLQLMIVPLFPMRWYTTLRTHRRACSNYEDGILLVLIFPVPHITFVYFTSFLSLIRTTAVYKHSIEETNFLILWKLYWYFYFNTIIKIKISVDYKHCNSGLNLIRKSNKYLDFIDKGMFNKT